MENSNLNPIILPLGGGFAPLTTTSLYFVLIYFLSNDQYVEIDNNNQEKQREFESFDHFQMDILVAEKTTSGCEVCCLDYHQPHINIVHDLFRKPYKLPFK